MDIATNVYDILVGGVFGNVVVGAIWTGIDRLNGMVLSPILASVTQPLGMAGGLLYSWTQNTIGSMKVDLTIKKHELL